MNAKLHSLRQAVSEYRRPVELFLFSLIMWAVVGCGFIALVTKAVVGKPGSVPVHYLLIAITVAASLAVLLPALLFRIGEISFGGVKVVLAQTVTALDDLQAAFDVQGEELGFEAAKLSDPQQ